MTRRRILIYALAVLLIPLLAEYRARDRRPELIASMVDDLRSQCGQSSALLAEYHQLGSDVTEDGYIVQANYTGRYYNFRDGERLVVGTKTLAPHTLWLFGNSGTMDLYLSDADTFAMHLQGYLPLYRVRNRSAWGQTIAGQLAWLIDTPVRAGDLVIFVDGYMDSGQDRRALLDQAQHFTLLHGAAWWHFKQPSASVIIADGISLNLTSEYFIEHAHLTEIGAAVEARKVYDWLSIY